MQMWALEMAEHGITANAYAPGVTDTRMWDTIGAGLGAGSRDEIFKAFQPQIALGRPATPEDIAEVVSYMASERSRYVTGQTLIVDGGIIYS